MVRRLNIRSRVHTCKGRDVTSVRLGGLKSHSSRAALVQLHKIVFWVFLRLTTYIMKEVLGVLELWEQ